MQRLSILFVAIPFFFGNQALAQARLSGFVTQQNSGKKPVAEVEVRSLFANPVRTGNDGLFLLVFQNQQPGATVNVEVQKTGWEVVNTKELSTALLQDPNARPFKIILCLLGELDRARKDYYNISDKYIQDEYARRMKALDRKVDGWQHKAAQYQQELIALQKQLHDLADEYSRLNLDDLNATERQALDLFKQGKIDESIALRKSLNSEQEITKALRRKAVEDSIIQANTRNLVALANEYQLKFDFINAEATLEKLAFTDTANYRNTFSFADYLLKQNRYNKALSWYQIALRHTKTEDDIAAVLNNLGALYRNKNEFNLAEQASIRALEIRERLAKTNSQTFEPNLAMTLNNLGILYWNKNEFSSAQKFYIRALDVYERLAQTNSQTFEPDLANTLNNVGILYLDKGEFSLAEQAFIRALEIRERLAKINSQTYEPDLAVTLNNLGNLYWGKNELSPAEKAYSRALEIRERLVTTNPSAFEPDLAVSLNNLANVYRTKDEFNLAEKFQTRALEVYEHLVKADPQTFEPILAAMLNNLGILYFRKKEFSSAQKAFTQALEIRRRLAKISPQTFEIEWCRTVVLIGYLQKANLQLSQLNMITAQLAEAKKKLTNYANVPLSTTLLKDIQELETYFAQVSLGIEPIKKQIDQTKSYTQKVVLQRQLIEKYQTLIDRGYTSLKNEKANSLGDLAWYQLFLKQFAQAEQSAREALSPTRINKPEGYDEAVEWVNTSLALALIYQGKLEEAKAIYLRLKDKPYDDATYRKAFLADLDELEKAGITHPDVAVIRQLLRS